MEITPDRKYAMADGDIVEIAQFLENNQDILGLDDAILYHDFPLYRDEDNIVISKALLLSSQHGVTVIGVSTTNSTDNLAIEAKNVERIFSYLYSRLFRNANLKKSITELVFPTRAIIFAPNLTQDVSFPIESTVIRSTQNLKDYLDNNKIEKLQLNLFNEIMGTIDGAKGIIRTKVRETKGLSPNSKGTLATKLETEIARFDRMQKYGQIAGLTGFERIRGLAGSGKTIVLAMKAAITHLKYPEAKIVYTFYTRSLYQLIRRLITRFYRQFDDRDPDWSMIQVIHGWGGQSNEGLYHSASLAHGVAPLSFREAQQLSATNPFGFACKKLIDAAEIRPLYDYIFIDEGQDFPISFVQLCLKLAEGSKVAYAYDDLQTIFQKEAPTPLEIGMAPSEDVILYKCYRNPREILVVGHALGFGLYSTRIVQMLENKDHWEDIGYKVIQGTFKPDSKTIIERPRDNSLTIISDAYKLYEIVRTTVYKGYSDEIQDVASNIQKDIKDGLRPDDILVAVVDDLNARKYLNDLTDALSQLNIPSHNIHADQYNILDFQRDGFVTLSTVHKAKGNEAYAVYVVGVDALFSPYAGGRERNILYTAITRAKGWVKISGIGMAAKICEEEINKALSNFPNLIFDYPTKEQIRVMRRDLTEKDARKQKAERLLDQVLASMTPDEIKMFVEQRNIKKGQNVKKTGKSKGKGEKKAK